MLGIEVKKFESYILSKSYDLYRISVKNFNDFS